jgi:hypothetical protein
MQPVRVATQLGLLGLLLTAASAMAGLPPYPANSTCCRWIFVGGFTNTTDGIPDPSIRCCITLRDFANNPMPDTPVEIDFGACCELELCSAVLQGVTVDCAGRSLRGRTNGSGQFCYSVIGAATLTSCTPPAIYPGPDSQCVRIYYGVDRTELCRATAVIYDLNGAAGGNGVNGADLGYLKNDAGASGLGAGYRGRSDYNCSGSVNGADIGRFKDIVGASGLGQGSAGGCSGASYCSPAASACLPGPCKSP